MVKEVLYVINIVVMRISIPVRNRNRNQIAAIIITSKETPQPINIRDIVINH